MVAAILEAFSELGSSEAFFAIGVSDAFPGSDVVVFLEAELAEEGASETGATLLGLVSS